MDARIQYHSNRDNPEAAMDEANDEGNNYIYGLTNFALSSLLRLICGSQGILCLLPFPGIL